MKQKILPILLILILTLASCTCPNAPPSDLADSGYYVRPSKVYFHPGFGLASPFSIQIT